MGGRLHEGAHSAGEYLYCTVTLLGGGHISKAL